MHLLLLDEVAGRLLIAFSVDRSTTANVRDEKK